MGADVVEEVTVMGNHDDRTEILGQKVLQPGDGVNVQVVGRLVHEDDIRIAEQRLRQQDFHLFVTGQVRHLLIEQTFRQTQTLDQLRGVCLCLPAVQFGKLRLQLRCQDAVLFGEVLLGVEGVLLLHDIVEPLVAHDDRVQHRVLVVLEVVLLQNAHPLILGDHHLAGGRLQIPGEDPQEGGLSGAVGADDAVAVAGNELQLHVLEQGLAAEVHAYIVDCDHVGILSSRSPRFSRRLLLLSVIAGQRSGRQTVPRRRIKKRRPNGRHRTLCCPKLVLLCCFFSLLSSILLHLYRN